ncbi:MAG: methionine adenosyltransferase [Bacilli bacterium]|jgi:S-adenosylmethionine synthetase|nr:methionine adenosyltransferase [Bacilli bacterium]
MKELRLFTSESVSEGHPDKICDQVSDAILDAVLAQDNNARVACECFVTTQFLLIGGEIRTSAKVDYEKIARQVIEDIGYTDERIGFDAKTCEIKVLIHEQSVDIAQGVDIDIEALKEVGAGDQGIMFGYACNETEGYMPLAIVLAHKLVREATAQRKAGLFKWARPDMKSQVTIDYSNDKPKVKTILMSIQHDEDFDYTLFKDYVQKEIINKVLASFNLESEDYEFYLNPTGRFVIGGPHGDSGLTGRKIIVDTYGGYARHGGGAFSGKDATKVDRSAAYAARWIAKNIVAANVCDEIEIQLSYGIGMAQPISIAIDTYKSHHVNENVILEMIRDLFDLRPQGIITTLELFKPIYSQVAAYGHMGRQDLDLPWERLNMVDAIEEYLENK